MKVISEKNALAKLQQLKTDFKSHISDTFEHRAKSCLTCETKGACCLDAHFVNVHISHLEAVAIKQKIETFPENIQAAIYSRVEATIEKYSLTVQGDTYAQTFACPLFEKGIGCLVHNDGKPLACIMHACYDNEKDLPPDHLLTEQEAKVDDLSTKTYGRPQPWLPLPLAIRSPR